MKKLPFICLILSMTIFGSVGVFVHYIPFPSAFLAMSRGLIGTLFVLFFLLISKKGIDFSAIRKNLLLLLISGAFIGINWILLFESFKHTTVAIATLCYYMAPLFVTVASAIFFKERLTPKKCICITVSVCGMVFVSGVINGEAPARSQVVGILLGIGAAFFYSCVTLLNKKAKNISSFDMTLVQLFFAAITVMPYSLICEEISFSGVKPIGIVLLILVGILHTGIAYVLYFTSVKHLEASKVAIFSYVDPILAILLSALFLKEKMTPVTAIGAIMILTSAFFGEVKISQFFKKREKR